MKCPNCGNDMPAGALYCEHCGEDIHIVPDFEPEIEQNIEDTIQGIADEIVGPQQENPEEKPKSDMGEKRIRSKFFLLGGLIVIVICGVCMAFWVYQYNSSEIQASRAANYVANEKYKKAIACFNRALEIDSENIELQFSLAEVYFLKNNKIEYEYLLRDIIKNPAANTEQLDRAYGKLIAIYRARDDYETISEILTGCDNSVILNTYQNYIASNPEFSVQEGYYTSVQILKISAQGSGKIYYTTDGTAPNEESTQYTAPLVLDNGDFEIKAIFINDNGVESQVVTKEYHIENDYIPAPTLNVISGEYSNPQLIEVEYDDGEVYYTTDGSIPTENSQLYTGGIPMPLGRSNFKFARVRNGVTGDVIERTFVLELDTDFSADNAVDAVIAYFLSTGKIYDEAGHFDDSGAMYRYEFQYAYDIRNVGDYYVVAEILQGSDGSLLKTGTYMAVDIYSGKVYGIQGDKLTADTLIDLENTSES